MSIKQKLNILLSITLVSIVANIGLCSTISRYSSERDDAIEQLDLEKNASRSLYNHWQHSAKMYDILKCKYDSLYKEHQYVMGQHALLLIQNGADIYEVK